MRLQSPGKRSQPPATAAQLRLVIPLYLANSCTLGPTQLLLQPCLRPVLGRSWGGREGRPRFPLRPCLPPHTPHLGTKSLSCVLSSLLVFAGGRQGLWLAQARPQLPGHCARAAPSCGGGCRTRLPGPAAWPCWARSKYTKIL